MYNSMTNGPKPLDLNEWAYMSIKMRILQNDFKPGTQLNIEDLTREFNISRTPIREALLRLRQDGLVASLSRVGFFVCGVTKEDFENIFELRLLIEAYAAQMFATRIMDNDIRRLATLNERCKKLAARADIYEFNACDTELHSIIIGGLNNKKMEEVYSNLGDLLYRIRVYALSSNDNMHLSLLEHDRIISALRSHDAAAAGQAMHDHIVNIRGRLLHIVDFRDDNIK